MKHRISPEESGIIRVAQRFMFLGVLLAGIWLPAPAWAVAPTVTNNSATLVTGTKKRITLSDSTTGVGPTYSLKYTIVDNPQRGTVTFPGLSYGSTYYCDYQSDQSGYVGMDSFTWCASSGSETSQLATCTVTITTNSVPVVLPASGVAISGVMRAPLVNLASFFTHASDDNGQIMTYMIVTPPARGTANVYSVYQTSGYVNYTSEPGFVGTDTFTWAVSDGFSTSAPANVSIKVGAGPIVAGDNSITLTTGTKKSMLLNNSAVWTGNTSKLTYMIVNNPQRGTATFPYATNATPYTYYCEYQSDQSGYVGMDSFTWCASSGSETSGLATCTVTITSNNVPVALSCIQQTLYGIPKQVRLASYVTHASSDYGQTMSYMIYSQPGNGTLTMGPLLGYVTYTHASGFAGVDTFTWAVSDGFSTSAPATVTVNMMPTPPVPTDQTALAPKNTSISINPLYTGGDGFACSLVKLSNPAHGTLTATNGTWFCFKPVSNYAGADSFKWAVAYSNATTPATISTTATCSIVVKDANTTADWTQWRFDECRSALSPAILPDQLYLQWRRDVPTCPGAFNSDVDHCRPVQLGRTLFVSLPADDSVTAYDADTGAQKWRYYTSGALRRPPAALSLPDGTNVVIVGCDDGYVYCLNAADGSEVWKFRAAPNAKKAMGFGRLGSAWPIMASPVVYQGKVYLAAGFIPTFGVYAYCLDAATGAVVWRNDGQMLKERISTLGPLAFSYDHTKIYGTRLRHDPWILDPTSGKMTGSAGGGGGNWFVDGNGDSPQREPMSITAGGHTFTPENVAALGVIGKVGSMLAGAGKLFVTTTNGSIYCFGGADVTPRIYPNQVTPLPDVADGWRAAAQSMLSRPDLGQGLALVWGVGTGRLVEELARQTTNLMIVAVDPDPATLKALRIKMDAAGLSGARVSTLLGNPMECGFAPYQAALIVSEDVGVAGFPSTGSGQDANGQAMVQMLYECTRPFGGEIWLPTMNAQHAAITCWVTTATNLPLCEVVRQTGFSGIGADGFTQIQRTGLPDEKVVLKPPFGLTAFSAMGSPSAMPIGFSSVPSKGALGGRDVYSWLPITAPMPGYEPVPTNNNKQLGKISDFPMSATMLNPLYSTTEKQMDLSLGTSCGGVRQYENQRLHLGKITSFGDPSRYCGILTFPEIGGCCNPSGYAADGIIDLQTQGYKNCNGLAMQFAQIGLTPMADEENCVTYRNFLSTATVQETPVRCIGVNFGAIADRYVAEEQMPWTHHPYYGPYAGRHIEVKPLLSVNYRGNVRSAYHHSAQMERIGDRYRGWVSASQVTGMDGLTVPLASPLVALRTATPPVVDGQLNDSCWDGRQRVGIPVNVVTKHYDPCFAMLRYDDTCLYVAGGLHERPHFQARFLKVVLNSRERTAPPLTLQTTNVWCKDNGLSDPDKLYTAELAIPWASLEAAGLWKEQLIMSVYVFGYLIHGDNWNVCYGPVYLDAARGSAAQVKAHKVRLHFAEMEDKPAGGRVFDVKLQGQTVLTSLDVAAEAGGPRRELMKEFQNVQIADKLDIDFARRTGEPILSGVEIIGMYDDSDLTNAFPVAVIDADALAGPAPLDVMLSARRSHDPDGQILECAWETGDGRLARGSVMRHVFAEPGAHRVNLLVLDNRGRTAVTNVIVNVGAGVPSSFVCKIRSGGGDYTNLATWETAIQSDLTSAQSLLFQVSAKGTYAAAADDGTAVTFSGGGTGTLKHINGDSIAYITGCQGAIQAGAATCASGHTFSIADKGNRIHTAVAECYNDWTNGLRGNVTVSGWITDENHCVTIRAAPGHGHTGKAKDAAGKYTGFAMVPSSSFDAKGTAHTRMERIIVDGGTLRIGPSGSINRVCANIEVYGTRATIANSAGAAFTTIQNPSDTAFYNCTGQGFSLASVSRLRLVNCLSAPGGAGLNKGNGAQYVSHCVSSDGSATNFYLSEQALDGNLAGQVVSVVDVANKDYHLAISDTGARGLGVPGLGADIDGDERVGPDYDVGADQTFGNHAPRLTGAPQATPNPAATGAVVRFTVAATDLDDDAMTYEWRFGDGDGTYGTNVTHVYTATGTYTARVAVSDGTLATTGSVVVSVLGVFDLWLVDHFGSTNAPAGRPSDDADHDGMSNAEEFLAGTDPTDPHSVFQVSSVECRVSGIVLQWRSESNKWYWIGKSTNLMTGFLPVISNIPATYPLNTCTVDVGSAQDGFFVIKLEQ